VTTKTPNLTDVVERALGGSLDPFAHRCHEASLALVKSRALEPILGHPGRVARGSCEGVGGQHSWVVAGPDVYNRHALIVDVTLWSYDATQDRVWVGNMAEEGIHRPHGSMSLWQWGRPTPGHGPTLDIIASHLSATASDMLDMLGPLDAIGWARLWSSGAMQGWPAGEILEAFLDQHPDLRGMVPIDIVGMLTDRNPDGLYLP
jgi:hypothetical protein